MADNVIATRMPPQRALLQTPTIDFPAMITMVIERGVDPAILQTMFQMYNEQQDRQAEEALNRALADVQGAITPVIRDAINKHLNNKYSSHGAIMDVLQPALRDSAVYVGFDCGAALGEPPVAEGCIRIRIVIGHGGFVDRRSYVDEPLARAGSRGGTTQMTEQQAIGSAMTYAQRNLLRLKFNLTSAADDDDGESTRGNGATQTTTRPANGGTQASERGWKDPKTGRDYNTAKWADSLLTRLAQAQTLTSVDALLAGEQPAAWLADPRGATDAERASIAAAADQARQRLAPTPTPPTAPAPNGTHLVDRLIARIASCQTSLALTSLMESPEFAQDMLKLSWIDGETVDKAMKARDAELASGPPTEATA